MGGDWIADIISQRMESDKEQGAYELLFADECRTILRACPLFIKRFEQMITEHDEKIDTMTGDELYKAIGARAQLKNIYGNIQHWAAVKPDIKEVE